MRNFLALAGEKTKNRFRNSFLQVHKCCYLERVSFYLISAFDCVHPQQGYAAKMSPSQSGPSFYAKDPLQKEYLFPSISEACALHKPSSETEGPHMSSQKLNHRVERIKVSPQGKIGGHLTRGVNTRQAKPRNPL